MTRFLFLGLLVAMASSGWGTPSSWVATGPDGRLSYRADAQGNSIPDFSRAGYRGGGIPLPAVAVAATLAPQPAGDDTVRIQQALDEVGRRPADRDGHRGALLLQKGTYRVDGAQSRAKGRWPNADGSSLIVPDGVVLRGEGSGEEGTVIVATGTSRRNVILLGDTARAPAEIPGTRRLITDAYVPWSARSFSIERAGDLVPGERVAILRPGSDAWISAIGMDRIPSPAGRTPGNWQGKDYDFAIERTIVAVEGHRVTVDAPAMIALDVKFGGGFLFKIKPARAHEVGLESLRIVSEYKAGGEDEDENHAVFAVAFFSAENGWARDVVALHTSMGFIADGNSAFLWIKDCAHLDPVSPITGGRRYGFDVGGQYILVENCRTRNCRHAFSTGRKVRGPNVFLDCQGEDSKADTGPHQRFAIGTLYDNVHDAGLHVQNRTDRGTGQGWAGAQQVFWNCVATEGFIVQAPPTAQNYAIGCVGKILNATRSPDEAHGIIESPGARVSPASLYRRQLAERLSISHPPDETNSPTP